MISVAGTQSMAEKRDLRYSCVMGSTDRLIDYDKSIYLASPILIQVSALFQ